MLPRVALLPSARAMLVPMLHDRVALVVGEEVVGQEVVGARPPRGTTAIGSAVPAGGCLLEWHCAQFSANARRPVLSVSADAVRYAAPPGASFSSSGFISLQERLGVGHPRLGVAPVLAVLARVVHLERLLRFAMPSTGSCRVTQYSPHMPMFT